MGKVYSSMVTRPMRNWNVEHRASDVISQAKPMPAPRHKIAREVNSEELPSEEKGLQS